MQDVGGAAAADSSEHLDWQGSSSTEQRRLRHVSEILVRNLSLSGAGYSFAYTKPGSHRAPLQINGDAGGAGSSSATTSIASARPARRPSLPQRASKDDIDIHRSSLLNGRLRTDSLRRKRTGSGGHGAVAGQAKTATPNGHGSDGHTVSPDGSKGKERAMDQDGQRSYAKGGQTESVDGMPARGDFKVDDPTDTVFGWVSPSPSMPTLSRSRSRGSTKSESSKRSGLSRRLFRSSSGSKKGKGRLSDEDEDVNNLDADEDGDFDDDDPRGMGYQARRDLERSLDDLRPPTSPLLQQRVSFQTRPSGAAMSSAFDGLSAQSPSALRVSRDRSASRSSAFSIASGSSSSTIRQIPPHVQSLFKQGDKLDRALRQRRRNKDQRSRQQLLRSRITISLPDSSTAFSSDKNSPTVTPARPGLSRSRTISLPLASSFDNSLSQSSSSAEVAFTTAAARSKPFFVSSVHPKSMDPTFAIDPGDFVTASSEDECGLQGAQRISVCLWVDTSAPQALQNGSNSISAGDWKMLFEWEVDLKGLTSLGSDPSLFPEVLPKNTLIFRLSNSSEYWTARLLPLFSQDILDEEDEAEVANGDENKYGRAPAETVSDPEDNLGHQSDPGTTPSKVGSFSRARGKQAADQTARRLGLDRRERERRLARQRMIMERSVRETKMMQGVDDEQLRLIVTRELEMRGLGNATTKLRRSVADILENPVFAVQRKYAQTEAKVAGRESDLAVQRQKLEVFQARKLEKVTALGDRRTNLRKARIQLEEKKRQLVKSRKEFELDQDVCASIRLSFAQRRAFLVSELATVFPIEPVDSDKFLFSICGVSLPNGNPDVNMRTAPLDDDAVSSALGYVAQVVTLLSVYLVVPLHYPIRCLASRSVIQDPISLMKGPKIYPLFPKGVDKYRFQYALFLINKDIQQLMLEYGLSVLDLHQTLPNLKNLYLTLSTDAPSQLETYTAKTPAGLAFPLSSQSSSPPGTPRLPMSAATLPTQGTLVSASVSSSASNFTPNGSVATLEKILETSLVLPHTTASSVLPRAKRATTLTNTHVDE